MHPDALSKFPYETTMDIILIKLPATSLNLVPMAGVEPAQLSPLPPQDSVSTNSTTSACIQTTLRLQVYTTGFNIYSPAGGGTSAADSSADEEASSVSADGTSSGISACGTSETASGEPSTGTLISVTGAVSASRTLSV